MNYLKVVEQDLERGREVPTAEALVALAHVLDDRLSEIATLLRAIANREAAL